MSEQTVWAKAKDVLWERGWNQDGFYGEHGEVCIHAAVEQAAGVTNAGDCWDEFGKPHVAEVLRDRGLLSGALVGVVKRGHKPAESWPLAVWNDTQATFDDVLDLLDELDKAEREASAL